MTKWTSQGWKNIKDHRKKVSTYQFSSNALTTFIQPEPRDHSWEIRAPDTWYKDWVFADLERKGQSMWKYWPSRLEAVLFSSHVRSLWPWNSASCYFWWWVSHSCQRMVLASSLKTFLINSSRCQGSKRDHFGKKLMWQSLAGSLSVSVPSQWTDCSHGPHFLALYVSTCFAMWLRSPCHWEVGSLSLESGSTLSLGLANKMGQKWHCVPVFRPKPQELCAVLPLLPLSWEHAPVSLLDRYAESWVSPVVTRDDSDTWDSPNQISKSF